MTNLLKDLLVFCTNLLAAELLLYGKFVLTDCKATVPSIHKTAYLLRRKCCTRFRTYQSNLENELKLKLFETSENFLVWGFVIQLIKKICSSY